MRSIKTPGLLSGVLALAMLMTGCGPGVSAAQGGQSADVGVVATQPPTGLCDASQGDQCFRVDTGQWVSVRHPLPGRGFVLLDMGGPGNASVDTGEVEASFPEWLKKFSVVKVYEPWVGRDLTEDCQKYFAHASWSLSAKDTQGCVDFISTLTQPPMTDVVAQVSRKLGQNLAGVVTFSFGSTRTQEIWPTLQSEQFLILVQPAPSPAVSVDRIISVRAAAAWKRLADLRAGSCGGTNRCLSIDELRARLTSPGVDAKWARTGTEMSLFVLGAVLDMDRYGSLLVKVLSDQSLSAEDASSVRRVAMSFTRTLDQDHALSSNAGYRSAMCQAYGPAGKRLSGDPLEDAFHAQVNVCGESLNPLAKSTALPTMSCLLVNRTDPAIPADLLDRVVSFGPSNTVEYHSTGHMWPTAEFSKLALSLPSGRAACSVSGH